jgi:hypothetical protein
MQMNKSFISKVDDAYSVLNFKSETLKFYFFMCDGIHEMLKLNFMIRVTSNVIMQHTRIIDTPANSILRANLFQS